MALRYNIDNGCSNLRPQTECEAPFAVQEPVDVRFRRGGNISRVVSEILSTPITNVHAAVGAGKSTKLPREIAKSSNTIVFMVVPNQLLAVQIYDYVTSSEQFCNDGVNSFLCETASTQLPSKGVVYIGASIMASLIMKQGYHYAVKDRIIFLDEAHESDAYSFVLRNLVVQMGARNLIRASATFSAEQFSMRETLSEVTEGQYDPEDTPDTWDLTDEGKPWYALKARNTLVYVDSEEDAMSLKSKYSALGYKALRLTSKTSTEDFRLACKYLQDPVRVVVLLLDYSYRSGFTFKASKIVDTGQVYYMSGKPGTSQICSRPIYEFEREQTKGRVGRLENQNAVYVRPDVKLEKVRVDLEGVEAEAAAYLYRLLGFKPTGVLAGRVMSKMDLAADVTVVQAFNSNVPLSCQKLQEPDTKSIPDRRDSVHSTDTSSYASSESVKSTVSSTATTISLEEKQAEDLTVDDWEAFVGKFDSYVEPELIEGKSYYPPSIPRNIHEMYCPLFPKGLDSIIQFTAKYLSDKSLWPRVSEIERCYAVSVLSRNYNMMIIECKAMRDALMSLLAEYEPDPAVAFIRDAVMEVVEEAKHAEAHRGFLFRTLKKFLISTKEVMPFLGLVSIAEQRKQFFRDEYKEKLMHVLIVSPDQYAEEIEQGVKNLNVEQYRIKDKSTVKLIDNSEKLYASAVFNNTSLDKMKFAPGTPKEAIAAYLKRRVDTGTQVGELPSWYMESYAVKCLPGLGTKTDSTMRTGVLHKKPKR